MKAATAIVKQHGGEFLVRGGAHIKKENAKLERTVVVEFPSYEIAQSVYDGDEYQNAIQHIKDCSLRDFVISEGL